MNLCDAMIHDRSLEDIGMRVILPSTFIGGPRHLNEYRHDAMSYVRMFGRPGLFITFTCNPKWREIKELLTNDTPAHYRHDLIARIFDLKLKRFIELITKHKFFGTSLAYVYTIEWQKRGLPHAHCLLWLQDRIHAGRIDDVICAELSDPQEDEHLFNIVSSHMIHGPCGHLNPNSVCMRDNQCTKRFPRAFLSDTQSGHDDYPLYRRRSPDQGGHSFTLNNQRNRGVTIDNRWVVPYNKWLLRIFNAHINVEYCHSVSAIKYICKYISKGPDMAAFDVESPDGLNEIKRYLIRISK